MQYQFSRYSVAYKRDALDRLRNFKSNVVCLKEHGVAVGQPNGLAIQISTGPGKRIKASGGKSKFHWQCPPGLAASLVEAFFESLKLSYVDKRTDDHAPVVEMSSLESSPIGNVSNLSQSKLAGDLLEHGNW